MEEVKYVIQKTFKGHNIGTTGVLYENKDRADNDCKALMDARGLYGILGTVRYKVIAIATQ